MRLGKGRISVVPSPSWPCPFAPQQYAAWLVVTPQVWLVPALSCAKDKRPGTGVETCRLANVPSPTCPSPLVPQQ